MKNKHMTPRARKEVDTLTFEGRFAVRLKTLREKAGMSVDELAEKTGISRATLFSWENGTRSPLSNDLLTTAEVLGVSVRSLIPQK